MSSNRSRRYAKKNPDLSQLAPEVLRIVAQFLPSEGIQPTRGKITSNYYNNSGIVYATNNPPGNRGLRYQLVNSPTRPLTERTKKVFANAQRKRGKNIARIHKNEAAHKFLYGLYNTSQLGPAGVKPATGSPIGITSYVNGGSPIYPSPPSSVGSWGNNFNNVEAVGGHMYLNADFKIGPSKAKKGTRNDLMRTSKSVRAALRPGPQKRRKKKIVA